MKRLPKVRAILTGVLLLAGCAAPAVRYNDDDSASNYDSGDRYGNNADYDASCDYYTPPWGYPFDYCRYELWSEPVYYGGVWYSGPIYRRYDVGENWFWLNGDWRRDEWRGPRPRIDWNRGGNVFWQGDIHRGRDGFDRRDRSAVRRGDDLRGSRGRGFDEDDKNNSTPSGGGGNGRAGDRGLGNAGRDANVSAPPNAGGNGRFGDRGVGNGGRDANVSALPKDGGNGRPGDRGVGNGARDANVSTPSNAGGTGRPGDRGVGNGARDKIVALPDGGRGPASESAGNNRVPAENVRKVLADSDKKQAVKPEADDGKRKSNGRGRGDQDDGR
jgi:hypothetical protein